MVAALIEGRDPTVYMRVPVNHGGLDTSMASLL